MSPKCALGARPTIMLAHIIRKRPQGRDCLRLAPCLQQAVGLGHAQGSRA